MQTVGQAAWHVRVRSTGRGRATAYVRTHQFAVGLPVHFDEQYDHVTALEYVLAAFGADLVNGLQRIARRRRVHIDNIEAVISGALNNPLMYLGVVGEAGHPGLERVVVHVYVSADADEAGLNQLWAEMLAQSPLMHTFQRSVQLDLHIGAVP